MNDMTHQTKVSIRLAGWLFAFALAGCGSRQEKLDPVSCRVQEGSRTMCMEYVHPTSDAARTSIWGQCRDGGGVITDACPVENFLGSCERTPDPRKPTTLSERVRMKYYADPGGVGAPDPAQLRQQCGADPWVDGPAAAAGSAAAPTP